MCSDEGSLVGIGSNDSSLVDTGSNKGSTGSPVICTKIKDNKSKV